MQSQLQREAWGAALQRAKGERVLDDPRLLKKSIKKVRREAGAFLWCSCSDAAGRGCTFSCARFWRAKLCSE